MSPLRSVLVVEDDPDLRESLSLILRGKGFHTELASNGLEALALLRKEPLDCVLLDLHMPVMNGFQFLEEQARDPALARVPVIAITSSDDDAEGPAVVASLRKPFGLDEFLCVLASIRG